MYCLVSLRASGYRCVGEEVGHGMSSRVTCNVLFLLTQRVDLGCVAYIAAYGKRALIRIRDETLLGIFIVRTFDKLYFSNGRYQCHGSYVIMLVITHPRPHVQ